MKCVSGSKSISKDSNVNFRKVEGWQSDIVGQEKKLDCIKVGERKELNEIDELRKKRAIVLKKRKHQQWFRIALACVMTGIMVLLMVHWSNRVNASDLDEQRTKYYTGIQIKEGDSLWSIAEEYISYEYDSIQEYIEEIKQVNQLQSDVIYEGRYLIVSYYK